VGDAAVGRLSIPRLLIRLAADTGAEQSSDRVRNLDLAGPIRLNALAEGQWA